ncbi:MAG TPA: hypothetical protein VGL57_01065 [Solirubrobacteraceae bacterium]|jgi:hypothetical protein
MKQHRTIVSIVTLLAGVSLALPSAALAGGPLLSGYGNPGAGAQTILGASLIGGTGGGSAGGGPASGGGAGSSSSGGATDSPANIASATGASAPARVTAHAASSANGTHSGAAGTRRRVGSATHPRAAGANPNSSSHLEGSTAVTTSDATAAWFSGSDLLALLLAAGALAAVAVATVRLARTEHE